MHYSIRFITSKFDVSKEKENPINPIYGYSLLVWLKTITKGKITISEPGAEDWGWYSYTKCEGREYMIGASVFYDKNNNPNSELEWVFQIDKKRSIIEKLLGKEKMSEKDPCLVFFLSIFQDNPEFKNIEVE